MEEWSRSAQPERGSNHTQKFGMFLFVFSKYSKYIKYSVVESTRDKPNRVQFSLADNLILTPSENSKEKEEAFNVPQRDVQRQRTQKPLLFFIF